MSSVKLMPIDQSRFGHVPEENNAINQCNVEVREVYAWILFNTKSVLRAGKEKRRNVRLLYVSCDHKL